MTSINDVPAEEVVDEDLPDDEWDDVYHSGCANWPNCDVVGCGPEGDFPGHRG